MNSSPRRALILLALLAVLVAGLLAVLNRRGASRLERFKIQLRARGDKLTLAELFTNAPPQPAQNFGEFIRLAQLLPTAPVHGSSVNGMTWMAPGRARAITRHPVVISFEITNTWEELDAQMAVTEDTYAAMREWLRDPALDSGWDWGRVPVTTWPNSQFINRRITAQALALAVFHSAHRRDAARTRDNLEALFSLVRVHENSRSLVDIMIRSAITGLGITATWEALQSCPFDDAALLRVQRKIEAIRLVEQLPDVVEFERAAGGSCFQLSRRDRALFSALQPSWIPTNSIVANVEAGLYQLALADTDELAYLEAMEQIQSAARSIARDKSFAAVCHELESCGKADEERMSHPLSGWRYRLSGALQPRYTRAFKSLLRNETTRSMLLADLGIRRFRLAHGRLPATLDELVPRFLAEVPRDGMDGKPLRYRVANGEPLLYSVGDDGRDDGGDGVPAEPFKAAFDVWDGRDAVWPRLGHPHEIAAQTSNAVARFRSALPEGASQNPIEECPLIVIDDVPFVDAVRNLARHSGYTVRFDPAADWWLNQPVSLRASNSTAWHVLSNVVLKAGLKVRLVPGTNVIGVTR